MCVGGEGGRGACVQNIYEIYSMHLLCIYVSELISNSEIFHNSSIGKDTYYRYSPLICLGDPYAVRKS